MSDIYTPNTTGGEAGAFIHDEIEEMQIEDQSTRPNGPSNLLPVQEFEELVDNDGNTYTVPKPIEFPTDQDAPFISYDQYEAEDRERFGHANTIVSATDKHALDLLSQINEQKQEIVNIMGGLFDSINSLNSYPAVDARLIAPTLNPNYLDSNGNNRGPSVPGEPLFITPSITDELGNKVSYLSGITTFTYPSSCILPNVFLNFSNVEEQLDIDGNPIPGTGRADCTANVNCCLVGIKAPIYPDILEAYIYPVLEDEDTDADIYITGAEYVKLKNSNVGVGKTSFTYGNSGGFTGFNDRVISYNSPLGYYYFWNDLQSFDSSAYDEIFSRISDIEFLRQDLKEFISDETSGTNNLREIRHNHQLDLWFGLLSRNTQVERLEYNKALTTLEDAEISGIIQNYDS